jgi:hypothetical protein
VGFEHEEIHMQQSSIVVNALTSSRTASVATSLTLSIALALGSCSTNRSEKGGSTAAATTTGSAKWSGHVANNFDTDQPGTLPTGWTGAETHGHGTPARWSVEKNANGAGNVLRITETKNSGSTFNLLLSAATYPADVELETKIHADAGNEDRGGGLVWRASDANNYYVTRWNPLEHDLRLYKVMSGQRIELRAANIDTDGDIWHKLEVRQRGTHIVVEFDGAKEITCDDDAITSGGKVGFWTKADAASSFDEFEVEYDR